ncbi:MAG TPA: metallophosphoesterase family protein [Pseudomonadales bacterium]|nr:metallophosphoesterase family protein [Pseudomonadales bacterium]
MWRRLILSMLPVLLAGCVQQQDAGTGTGTACSGSGSGEQPARLFLQQVSDSGALVRWRGESRVLCFGTQPEQLSVRVDAHEESGHIEAALSGLQPDTVYYYALGNVGTAPATQHFRTAPKRGALPADGNTRILLLGDSGTAAAELDAGTAREDTTAMAVANGVRSFIAGQGGGEAIDLLLLLGDNAYLDGSDEQWEKAFFGIYPEMMRSVATWPTIGNHEMGQGRIDVCQFAPMPQCAAGPVYRAMGGTSESTDPASYDSDGNGPDPGGMPYLSIFNLPTRAELGGVPSGTEQYYSFDHANIHVVSLDSQLSNRDPAQREAMRQWLVNDLEANDSDWTIVIFHHPPYSRGVHHDSDVEQAEIDMRQTFGPVFEAHGVDVVFSGHAHSYERSWYLHGHQGKSTSFDAARHAELNKAGEPAIGQNEESYRQISPGSGRDDKVVYTVAGNAGQADRENPCQPGHHLMCTSEEWLTHPAHRRFETGLQGYRPHGIARTGAVVLDVDRNRLSSRFVDQHGEVLDWFVIER